MTWFEPYAKTAIVRWSSVDDAAQAHNGVAEVTSFMIRTPAHRLGETTVPLGYRGRLRLPGETGTTHEGVVAPTDTVIRVRRCRMDARHGTIGTSAWGADCPSLGCRVSGRWTL